VHLRASMSPSAFVRADMFFLLLERNKTEMDNENEPTM